MIKTLGSLCFTYRRSVAGAWIAVWLFGTGPMFAGLDSVAVWPLGLGLILSFELLLVIRYREETALGHIRTVAISRTWATAGRTVAFSGITVAGGFCALLLSADSSVRAVGVAGACTALLAVLFALTLTAAVLAAGTLGAWVGPPVNRRVSSTNRTFFDRLVVSIQCRPVVVMASVGAALAALALPSLDGRPSLVAIMVFLLVALVLIRITGSVVIALTALLTSALSLGATLGVLTLFAQYGWSAPIAADELVVVLAVGFGLSMVFEVFVVCRIKEYVDAGLPTDFAVRRGFARTGTVVARASALIVLGLAWVGFAWDGPVGQICFGLCVAMLLDAVLVRGLLVPARMTLLDGWNWWAPRRTGVSAASTAKGGYAEAPNGDDPTKPAILASTSGTAR